MSAITTMAAIATRTPITIQTLRLRVIDSSPFVIAVPSIKDAAGRRFLPRASRVHGRYRTLGSTMKR
jgi:hypothetical protein